MNLGKKNPWYSAGLHFECLCCGRCCAGPEQGYIWVSRPEIRLIADFLKIPVKKLKQKFLRRVGFRMTIVEDPNTRDCAFLKRTEQGRGCAIYDVRPAQCRNWPFWPVNLTTADAWNSVARRCPGINIGRLYSCEEIRDKTKNKKCRSPFAVWHSLREGTMELDEAKLKIAARVNEIYNWLDNQLANNADAGQCAACGKCCDFESYGHRLYVTTPEMIYFVEKIGKSNVIASEAKQSQPIKTRMTTGRCPYKIDGKCVVYPHRFSACRIFCCKGDAAFQSDLTEAVIKKFKSLCDELDIPYRYAELAIALK